MIHLNNVSYAYEKGGGVSNINMSIADDEYAFLIGPTGSGKTTLLRLIYMDLLPQVGNVEIDEYDSTNIKQKRIAFLRRKVGMIFQDYHLLDDRNLFNNIALPLHVIGYDKEEIVDLVSEALEEVGLDGKEDHFPNELSGGEQQRACVARAMIKGPDIILADEPTGNLDPVTSFELIKLLEEVNKEGTAILMASHNYNLIKGRGHRIIEIQDGTVRRS
jgi:cell division transport system ATP-binding protein